MLTASSRYTERTRGDEVASERRDNYSLHLSRARSGNVTVYTVEVRMRIVALFLPGSRTGWTRGAETAFINEWERLVNAVWSIDDLLPPATGRRVHFRHTFDFVRDPTGREHWTMLVHHRDPGDPPRGRTLDLDPHGSGTPHAAPDATVGRNIVELDQTVVNVTNDGHGPYAVAVHEYGHMLGYRTDEYDPGKGTEGQQDAVMNMGIAIYPRHIHTFTSWAQRQIQRDMLRNPDAGPDARRRLLDGNRMSAPRDNTRTAAPRGFQQRRF